MKYELISLYTNNKASWLAALESGIKFILFLFVMQINNINQTKIVSKK